MIRKLPLNSKAVTKRLTFFIITAFLISPAFGQKYVEMMADETVNFFEVQKEANKYFDSVGTERGNGYKQYKRWEYETSLNIDEYGNRLSTKQIEEETQKVVARLKNARTSKIAATTWTELGPTYKNPTSGWNPGVGRVSAIAVEPVNKQLIYVGTPEGGLWKSTNGGSTWTPMFDQNTNMKIFAIAMDPNNSNIVYVGTEGAGLYKTTNGGSSWTTINFTSSKIGKIIINPNNTANLLAATKNGIYRSTNSGSNWTRTYTASVEDIEFKPGDVNTVYA
ncbi:MAG TPA: YCF48-related protein, partial [Cytophagaceae bacterium]